MLLVVCQLSRDMMLLAVKTVKRDWCVSIRLLLVKCPLVYYQRITLESWFTNLEQTPLNRFQQLPAPYKRLITDNNKTDKQ